MLEDKYKRLFGIDVELVEFSPEVLKSRWRHLCQKYHPDDPKGTGTGNADHFRFVQEAYKHLKTKCKGIKIEEEEKFISELYGIRELEGSNEDGSKWYLWDIGEANFQKRADFIKKYGKGTVKVTKKRSFGYA